MSDIDRVEKEALELFGMMRDSTKEEYESTNNYIKNISTDTGENFYERISST